MKVIISYRFGKRRYQQYFAYVQFKHLFELVLLLFFMLFLGFGGDGSGMGTEEDRTLILVFLEVLEQG